MATPESTRDLIAKAQAGDRQAFEGLVELHREKLLERTSARLGPKLRGRLEADDIVQEAFAVAWGSIGKFRWQGDGSFRSWLSSIAEHLIWNASQKKGWNDLELRRAAPNEQASPSADMRREERFERLEQAIRGLSDEHRTALLLARIDGLAVREIAVRMNRSPNAVSKLLARALAQLKREFGDTESLHLPQRTFRFDEADHDE